MVPYRIVTRPAFEAIGRKTWIGGPDNEAFGRFWAQCHADGTIAALGRLRGGRPNPQTGSAVIGLSCVEQNPALREFDFLIAIETPADLDDAAASALGLERHAVPAAEWAVFEGRGEMPAALVAAEMYAFMEWLPASGYVHAAAPEMEVYPPTDEPYCEFWLPIVRPA
jgi:AraC family transcriptional regulator